MSFKILSTSTPSLPAQPNLLGAASFWAKPGNLRAVTLLVSLLIGTQFFYAQTAAGKGDVVPEENLTLDRPTYELWQEGLRLMNSDQYAKAADIYRKCVELLPGKASPHTNLMNCLIKLGDTEGAVKEAEAAANISPNTALYMFNLGNTYQIAGRLDDAISTYNECIHKFPSDERSARVKAVIKELKKAAKQKQGTPERVGLVKNEFSKWRRTKMPIRISIEPGDGVNNYNENYRSILMQAFQDWANASQGRVAFQFVNRNVPAEITVVWEAERTKLTEAEDGNTHLEYDNKGMNTASKIILLTTTIEGKPMTDAQMKEVSLHEVGHSLGITQHSRNPEDIMFYSMHGKDRMTELSEHDKDTVRQLYDCPDAPIPTAAPPTNAPIQFQFQH